MGEGSLLSVWSRWMILRLEQQSWHIASTLVFASKKGLHNRVLLTAKADWLAEFPPLAPTSVGWKNH